MLHSRGFGGKSRAADLIWPHLGDVANYIEPFAGSLAVLLNRPHDPRIETVNDLDAYLSNFWRAIQADPEQVALYADWPVSEADLHARHRWLLRELPAHREKMMTDPDYFDAKIAGWWVWGLCQWIGGGWCSEAICWGPDQEPEKRRPGVSGNTHGQGVHRKRPVAFGDNPGRGVHRIMPMKRPHCGASGSGSGTGVHRQKISQKRGAGQRLGRPSLGGESHQLRGVFSTTAKTEGLVSWFQQLQQRLRSVRVCCGSWTRVLGPAVIYGSGVTGIVLDPPYDFSRRDVGLYGVESDVSAAVRTWAIEHGEDKRLRIALCGYEGEHEMPANWIKESWMPIGGYGLQGNGRARANRKQERIWFSPHCLRPDKGQIALFPVSSSYGDLGASAQ